MNRDLKCKVPPTGARYEPVEYVAFNGLGTFRLDNGKTDWRPADFTDGYRPDREDVRALKIQTGKHTLL
jgi:hypothetical protein